MNLKINSLKKHDENKNPEIKTKMKFPPHR